MVSYFFRSVKEEFKAFRVLLVQYSLFRHKCMSWLQVLANHVFLTLLMVSPKVHIQIGSLSLYLLKNWHTFVLIKCSLFFNLFKKSLCQLPTMPFSYFVTSALRWIMNHLA